MSKKNNKATKRAAHAYNLEREREQKEALAKKAAKRERQAAAGKIKKKVNKTVRLRKGIRIKGIKVVDSSSKTQVKALLRAQAALKHMDVDQAPAPRARQDKRKAKAQAAPAAETMQE